jgi:hypothetical protein
VEPSVVYLDGVIASLAVTECLAFLAGVCPPQHYTYYDLLEDRVGRRIVQTDPRCPACAAASQGERANIERLRSRRIPSRSKVSSFPR